MIRSIKNSWKRLDPFGKYSYVSDNDLYEFNKKRLKSYIGNLSDTEAKKMLTTAYYYARTITSGDVWRYLQNSNSSDVNYDKYKLLSNFGEKKIRLLAEKNMFTEKEIKSISYEILLQIYFDINLCNDILPMFIRKLIYKILISNNRYRKN